MINRKNYYILAGIIFVVVFAYLGLLALTGFTKSWEWWRMILFFVITFTLTFWPLAIVLKIYTKMNEVPVKKSKDIPVMKAETL